MSEIVISQRNLVTRGVAGYRNVFDGEWVEAREWQEVDQDLPVIATKGRLTAAGKTEESARRMIERMETGRS
jgi:hypothetical protein